MRASSPPHVQVYKAGRVWTAVCQRCSCCLGVSPRRKNVQLAAFAHQCSATEPRTTPADDAPFRQAYFPPRILATFCNHCSSPFFTPRLDVLRMVQRVHRCAGMKKPSASEDSLRGLEESRG